MKIRTLGNVKHNGVEYGKGGIISDLSDEQAKSLISSGMAEKIIEKTEKMEGESEKKKVKK